MRWPWQRRRAPLDLSYVDDAVSANVALVGGMDKDLRARHRELTAELIVDKRWEPAAGFALTAQMIATIAANAVIPILGLDMWIYRQVNSIIVHPTSTTTQGRRSGPAAGTESDAELHVIGLAAPNSGPVSVSWDAALHGSRNPGLGRNVVIHEFAHKIDMSDGMTDGVPPLRGEAVSSWEAMLTREYEHANSHESDHALRPYAWTNRAEFFAVASEAFFCTPQKLRAAKPDLYGCLSLFYSQTPAG